MRALSLPLSLVLLLVAACGAEPEPVADVADAVDVGAEPNDAPIDPRGSDAVDIDAGRALFEHAWVKNDPRARGGDGLGPFFNASSCVACHAQGGPGGSGASHNNVVIGDGRVYHRHGGWAEPPPLVSVRGIGALLGPGAGGSGIGAIGIGGLGLGNILVRETTASIDRAANIVIVGALDKAIVTRVLVRVQSQMKYCYEKALNKTPGIRGKVTMKWVIAANGDVAKAIVSETTLKNDDVEACLVRIHQRLRFPEAKGGGVVTVTQPYVFSQRRAPPPPPPPPPEPSVRVERNTPALFGVGLIDDIPDDVIEANAQTSHAGHPEITGKVGRTVDGLVTRFGWKGDVPDLVTFVSRACSIELGLEVPGSPQPGRAVDGYDIDVDDLEDLIAFVRKLPRPTERREGNQVASEGAEIFDDIGCTACHTPALGEVDGLYSDLLLHDMGAELDDVQNVGYYGAPAPLNGSAEWRTPPLWGARDSAPYMHDGRARTLERAIALHGGEAWRTRQLYRALNDDEKGAVIAFLESLRAPQPRQ